MTVDIQLALPSNFWDSGVEIEDKLAIGKQECKVVFIGKNFACFSCGIQGHIKRNCKTPIKRTRQNISKSYDNINEKEKQKQVLKKNVQLENSKQVMNKGPVSKDINEMEIEKTNDYEESSTVSLDSEEKYIVTCQGLKKDGNKCTKKFSTDLNDPGRFCVYHREKDMEGVETASL